MTAASARDSKRVSGYTVKQVARASGVSVRTLHHYDEIGLLKPDRVGAGDYRQYGPDQLLRLQQILFHRELGFRLEEIRQVLDAPGFDRVAALKRHRERLLADARRYRRLVRTIDETLAALQGATSMNEKELYRGFSPEKQAEYEAWLVGRYGEGMRTRIDESKRNLASLGPAEIEAMKQEGKAVEDALVEAFEAASPAGSAPVQTLMRRHHAWVSLAWNRPAPAQAYAGLGALYLEHPDMRARYEARAPGLAEWLAEAMSAFAERELA
jgi:DNA-binding transcriptional MerR regulator